MLPRLSVEVAIAEGLEYQLLALAEATNVCLCQAVTGYQCTHIQTSPHQVVRCIVLISKGGYHAPYIGSIRRVLKKQLFFFFDSSCKYSCFFFEKLFFQEGKASPMTPKSDAACVTLSRSE